MRVALEVFRTPRGLPATLRAVRLIRQQIQRGARNWKVRQRAVSIVRRAAVPAHDYAGELRALYQWTAQHLRYTRDPHGTELVHSAEVLLELVDELGQAAGDCDDQSVLLGALCASIGFPVAVRIVGRRAGEFSHVHLRIKVGARWVPADLTAFPRKLLGYEPRAPFERVWLLDGKEVTGMETYTTQLEGMDGPAEMTETEIAYRVGELGYSTYEITPDGQVIGVREAARTLDGFFDFVGDVVGTAVGGAKAIGSVMSQAAPIVGMINPAAGAALSTGGAVTSGLAQVASGGGRRPAPPRPGPAPRAALPPVAAALPAPRSAAPPPKPTAAPPRGSIAQSRPMPQAIAITKGPGGGGFWQKYKWFILGGAGLAVVGGGAYYLSHKKKGKRR